MVIIMTRLKTSEKEKNDEVKEAECHDDNPPAVIEESVSDKNYDKNENMIRGKR